MTPPPPYLDALLAVGLLVQQQLALQQESLPAVAAALHAVVGDVHVFLQVPAVVEDARTFLTGEMLLLLQPDFLAQTLHVRRRLPTRPLVGQRGLRQRLPQGGGGARHGESPAPPAGSLDCHRLLQTRNV